MLSSFFSGISGLMANSYGINVVGNNIANVNTIGYKGAGQPSRTCSISLFLAQQERVR